jgi:PAS domain S-box-containing protein
LGNSINVESIRSDDGLTFVVKKGEKTSGHQKFLDKIPECAAIVQRGVLKQVNGSFAELLGYDIKEMVDKSLFDFVVPEGLSEIEKYYFNRLKGKDVSSYETIFLTSDDERMPVKINIKPVLYDGEKGDIAIVKSLAAQSKKKTNNQ